MTVDKVKLKALAEAATQGEWVDDPSALGGIVRAGPVLNYSRGSGQSQIAMMTGDHWMKPGEPKANAAFIAAAGPETVLALLAEIDQLKGIQPGFPPRPPEGEGLPRYGLRWNGPQQPLATPMDDGYWTPWHLAEQLKAENERYRKYGCDTCDGSGHLHRADGEYFGECTSCGAYELEQAKRERDQLKAKLAELESIGELINSQDNRCTDQPMFAVMEKRGMITLDTHDHDRIEWYDPVNISTADDRTAARLEALHDGGRDVKHWERYAIKDVDVFVTACFTEQGCKDFLAIDGHNHREPFIYAFGSFRNGEYQSVRNWLKSLPKKMGD